MLSNIGGYKAVYPRLREAQADQPGRERPAGMMHLRYMVLLGVCLMATFARAHGAGTLPLMDPYSIFDRTRTYWDTASYPRSLSYEVGVVVTRHGVVSTAHYRAYYDTASNRIMPKAVSEEELAHPYRPRGLKLAFSQPEHTFDYLGVPVLAPNYSFGLARVAPHVATVDSRKLVQQIRAAFDDPAPSPTPDRSSGLKTIAIVAATNRHYIITLDGVVTMGDHEDYHLLLKPILNSSSYRLREVWVDTRTFATDQLETQGNFSARDLATISWIVSFGQIDGAPYIRSERASSGFALDRRPYDAATIEFTDISSARIPPYASDSMFAVQADTAPEILREPNP